MIYHDVSFTDVSAALHYVFEYRLSKLYSRNYCGQNHLYWVKRAHKGNPPYQ